MAPIAKLFVFTVVIPLVFLLRFCSGCIHKERDALLQFKAALNYSSSFYPFYSDLSTSSFSPPYSNLDTWRKGGDCCSTWDGITCDVDSHHVVGVDIWYRAEGGVISESLCTLTSLASLDLSDNGLTGTLPHCLGNMSSLTDLHLSYNNLNGSIPSSLSFLSSLIHLDLSSNQLSGCIPESLGDLSLLVSLDLSYNQLTGTVPLSFSKLSFLETLCVERNRFNQSIASPALPSSLVVLFLTCNGGQTISEAFFHNLSQLRVLRLSNCIFNFSPSWLPPFQLRTLAMTSCKMDGQIIPLWISTQFALYDLGLGDNNLVGEIPSWLWDLGLHSINLTKNHLEGRLLPRTSAWKDLQYLDVSNNELCGEIPSTWPPLIQVLLLNNNSLTGNIPPRLQGFSLLTILNLANNRLNGIIPPSLANCSQLLVLNLGENNLSGMMPAEFGMLNQLESLVIRDNKVSGFLPASISNCTELKYLDIGHNLFKGPIPKSIGNVSELRVLSMRKNSFEGSIPADIMKLKNLRILDLSSNQLSGFIPGNISGLQAMSVDLPQEFKVYKRALPMMFESRVHTGLQNPFMPFEFGPFMTFEFGVMDSMKFEIRVDTGLHMDSKGRDENYTYIFPALASLDLSDNQLKGDVPLDLGKLKGLKLLNLSMNNLNGTIPNTIIQMCLLESLDFSTNNFCGQIPDLGSLSYLGVLNFSNNNLSGSIPQGGHMTTFTNLSYLNNSNLWGCPLAKKCPWPEFTHPPIPISTFINEEEQSQESLWYEIGLGLTYGIGFAIVVMFIVLKVKWGHKYFKCVDSVLKFCFPSFRNLTV